MDKQCCFFQCKTQKTGADAQEDLFIGFVGGQAMGGAASLCEFSVKVIILSIFRPLTFPLSSETVDKNGSIPPPPQKREKKTLPIITGFTEQTKTLR